MNDKTDTRSVAFQNAKYNDLMRRFGGVGGYPTQPPPAPDQERGQTMTTAERVAALRQRRQSAGLVRVEVYVPADRVEEIKEAAREMQEGVDPPR